MIELKRWDDGEVIYRAEGTLPHVLEEANRKSISLDYVNLEHENLRGVMLNNANLFRANLKGADLRESFLKGAYMREADLTTANLSKSYLRDANLIMTVDEGTNFDQSNTSGTSFGPDPWVSEF